RQGRAGEQRGGVRCVGPQCPGGRPPCPAAPLPRWGGGGGCPAPWLQETREGGQGQVPPLHDQLCKRGEVRAGGRHRPPRRPLQGGRGRGEGISACLRRAFPCSTPPPPPSRLALDLAHPPRFS